MGRGHFSFCGVPAEAVDQMNVQLRALVESDGIECAMVVDQSGYLIASSGTVDYLPLEELATITAGAFASYVLTLKVNEMAADFYSRGVCSQYCLSITSQLFLLVLRQRGPMPESLRARAKAAAAAISVTLGPEAGPAPGVKLDSMHFISKKLDEMFDDS